jgi:hypothetical protein
MKTKSIARANTVYSVKLRKGGYALLQTLDDSCQIAVFDEFRNEPDWDGVKLLQDRVLFYCYVIKNFFQNNHISKVKSVSPCERLSFPNEAISLNGFKKITLWKKTKSQREIGFIGETISVCTTTWNTGRPKLSYRRLSQEDYASVKHLELAGLRAYPELNERLSLCHELGFNIDPQKEIAFERPLNHQFETYVDIIGGLVPSAHFGY